MRSNMIKRLKKQQLFKEMKGLIIFFAVSFIVICAVLIESCIMYN